MATLHHHAPDNALDTLQNEAGGSVSDLDGIGGHDQPENYHMLAAFVGVHRTALAGVESISEIAASYFLDARQSRSEYVWNYDVLRERHLVAVNHDFCLPAVESPFHNRQFERLYLESANQFDCDRGYAIAPLRGPQPQLAAASARASKQGAAA